jgi:hypothetical protein
LNKPIFLALRDQSPAVDRAKVEQEQEYHFDRREILSSVIAIPLNSELKSTGSAYFQLITAASSMVARFEEDCG